MDLSDLKLLFYRYWPTSGKYTFSKGMLNEIEPMNKWFSTDILHTYLHKQFYSACKYLATYFFWLHNIFVCLFDLGFKLFCCNAFTHGGSRLRKKSFSPCSLGYKFFRSSMLLWGFLDWISLASWSGGLTIQQAILIKHGPTT